MGLRASDQRDVMPPPDDAAPPLRIRFIVSSLLITSPDRKDVIILMPNVEIAHLLTKRKNDERTNERKKTRRNWTVYVLSQRVYKLKC